MADSRNPMLRKNVLTRVMNQVNVTEATGSMTVSGTIDKAGILFLLLVAGGAWGWNLSTSPAAGMAMMVSIVVALIFYFGMLFAPQFAAVLAPAYAVAEGVGLGVLSGIFDMRYPGIALNAMILTFGTLGVMLFVYRTGLIKVTERFRRMVLIGVLAVMATYVVDWIMMFFGHSMAMIHSSSPVSIGFSLIVVGLASFCLVIDFDNIKQAVAQRMPKQMEWYCAFSLMVTLIWLYIEILNLLMKLNSRRN